jgi:inhibitor of cysteine peptidase
MAVFTLTKVNNGSLLSVNKGDAVNVSLPETPTTGYRWAIDSVDGAVLQLQNSTFALTPGVGIGGGGTRTMTFQAVRPGSTNLSLKLWRDWIGDSSTVDRFGAIVKVQQ